MIRLDHLVVSASDLGSGTAWVEQALGVPLSPGGKHVRMSTHNRLLNVGPVYLEVIAIDPDAPALDRPRWFDLDRFEGAPRLTNWVVQTPDLAAALVQAPEGAGVQTPFERGDLRWAMALPDDGRLPFDNMFPAMIQWQTTRHPADMLEDRGCRLRCLHVTHPKADSLKSVIEAMSPDLPVRITAGEAALRAEIDTPNGLLWL